MKKPRILLVVAGLLLSAWARDIGFTVGDAVRSFPEIVVVNTDTGCTSDYIEEIDLWRVWDTDGALVFEGVEGAAMHALLFRCP